MNEGREMIFVQDQSVLQSANFERIAHQWLNLWFNIQLKSNIQGDLNQQWKEDINMVLRVQVVWDFNLQMC